MTLDRFCLGMSRSHTLCICPHRVQSMCPQGSSSKMRGPVRSENDHLGSCSTGCVLLLCIVPPDSHGTYTKCHFLLFLPPWCHNGLSHICRSEDTKFAPRVTDRCLRGNGSMNNVPCKAGKSPQDNPSTVARLCVTCTCPLGTASNVYCHDLVHTDLVSMKCSVVHLSQDPLR